jgi:tRNA(adenine34) deaminase
MHWDETDIAHMRTALAQAGLALKLDEVPVGAVVVIDGQAAGLGHNRSITDHDPSAHAEIVAVREAGVLRHNHRLVGATLYVTLEPCAMCVAALSQARVTRVVFGAYDLAAGAAGSVIDFSESPAFNHHPEINGGLLAEECGALLSGFFAERRREP